MPFWAYMLQCRGGYLYVGQTDDLAQRLAQHERGALPGFTRDHLPITLVWSQEFQAREAAEAAEKRIKGWSRGKKLALIRGDWERISQLARKKGSPSTRSGQAEEGRPAGAVRYASDLKPARPEPVEALSFLSPHPDWPPLTITEMRARITAMTEHWLTLRWSIAGAGRIVLPAPAGKRRSDGLWRHTCFEIFVQAAHGDAYVELNLAPSEAWAAYDFAGYRAGLAERAMPRPPDCTARSGRDTLIFDAAVPMAGLPPLPWCAGVTAVIEEEGGVLSYWALAHPPGPPDFHNPACRALTVAAPAPR